MLASIRRAHTVSYFFFCLHRYGMVLVGRNLAVGGNWGGQQVRALTPFAMSAPEFSRFVL